MRKIQMVDLGSQYERIKTEIDSAINKCIVTTTFINGPDVSEFSKALASYLDVNHVIACANGTDALQIALMALGLQEGDEVIVPAFTYVATAEVIGLLKLKPVMVDVDPFTFNITAELIKPALTSRTRVIVPVHLFGQCADMEPILKLAKEKSLYVVEDTAQALGAKYTFSDGTVKAAGTMGDIGTTSFFPSKNLGCYGDGGAIMTNNSELSAKITMIANHGQVKKYVHKVIGVNSRLDTIQAAILKVKLQYLDQYASARNSVAAGYDKVFEKIGAISIPVRQANSSHVFHQYTLKVPAHLRTKMIEYLKDAGIPSMVYYPIPLNEQEAFAKLGRVVGSLSVTQELCNQVISLPIHTEFENDQLQHITDHVTQFFISNKA